MTRAPSLLCLVVLQLHDLLCSVIISPRWSGANRMVSCYQTYPADEVRNNSGSDERIAPPPMQVENGSLSRAPLLGGTMTKASQCNGHAA